MCFHKLTIVLFRSFVACTVSATDNIYICVCEEKKYICQDINPAIESEHNGRAFLEVGGVGSRIGSRSRREGSVGSLTPGGRRSWESEWVQEQEGTMNISHRWALP